MGSIHFEFNFSRLKEKKTLETNRKLSVIFPFLLSGRLQPETVPQAIIDMNRVVEVSEAEEVTGHPFSLALTAADRVHFLKGTSREESKWWFDVLSMFPRTNMKVG